jgi:predicted alpha/beta superfamily hydrolase
MPVNPNNLPLAIGRGAIRRHADFPSRFIAPRHVDVWLPPGYHTHPEARFPVLLMHDGQNLFDPGSAYGKVDWGIDEAVTRLSAEGRIPETIVVGVWNSPLRWREYMPQKVFAALQGSKAALLRTRFLEKAGGESCSDSYLRFLVEELKPFIDSTYRTLPGKESTFIMGSSMGGLISLYAICEYPHVFQGAGCLSTHWPAGENFIVDYLGARLPEPSSHRLYFDYGTLGLDAGYPRFQQRMDRHLTASGYLPGKSWLTRKFDGADHNEASWRERLHIPLEFLLGIESTDLRGK